MAGDNPGEAKLTIRETSKINNVKLYVPLVTLSVNYCIKFLQHFKQAFRTKIS